MVAVSSASRPALERIVRAHEPGSRPAWRLRPAWSPLYLAVPAVLFVGVFGVYPLVSFLLGSLVTPGGLSLAQYAQLVTGDLFLGVLVRTLSTAVTVTAACLLLAYPMAYALMKAAGVAKTVLIALVLLPYLTSVLVRVYAWSALLATNGPVNDLLQAMGIGEQRALLGHSDFGIHLGMIHILLPIAVLTIWARLEKVDPTQEVAASALGASRIRSFGTVFLPQSLPGVASAGVLVYVLSLGAYVIPAALGGVKGLLFAQVVADQATQLLNWSLAGAMGALMLVAAAVPPVIMVLVRRVAARLQRRPAAISRVQLVAARRVYPLIERIPVRVVRAAWRSAAALVLLFLVMPELVILVFSVGPRTGLTLVPAKPTLDGYASVLSDPSWLEPLGRSFEYAAIDAVLATALGALAAYGFARGGAVPARIGTAVLLVPIVLPEIVVAISYYVFANGTGLASTAQGVVLGQAMSAIGLVVVVLTAVMSEVDVNLEYAAQMAGAGRGRVLREIVAPLVLPGLLVGLVYAFLTAFDNLVLPLFITGTQPTVTVRMFLSMQEQLTSSPAVIASLLIVVLALCIATAVIIQRAGRLRVVLPVDTAGRGAQ